MAKKKKSKKGNAGSGLDLIDKEKAKKKVKPPSKYQVIYYNDDFTPMDLVVQSLIAFFHKSAISAIGIMMHVHKKGKGIAGGPYSKEIADTKAAIAVEFFRSKGHPLLAKSEKIE
jgi:ATP-dependent Clp protease adaptor protein ClpS